MSSRSSTSFARLRKKFHFILLASFFTVSALECSKQAEYRDIDQGDEEVEMEADLNDEAEAEIELEIERPFDSEDELDAADEEPRLDFEEKDEDADLSEEENEPEITDELEDATDEASDEKDGEGIGEAPDSADDDDEAPDEEDEDQTTEEEDAKDYLDDVELFDEEAEEGLCYDCEVQCQSGEDCRGLSFVCIDGRCAHCVSDAQCKDEITGGYDERAKCFNGICASDWCETGFDCPDGKPACREGFCAGCIDDWECGLGKCLLAQGICYYGECYSAGSSCGSYAEKICGDDLVCRRCRNDSECVNIIAHERAICEYGSCRIGCRDAPSCAPGWVCGAAYRCAPCESDEECVYQYGQNYKCAAGLCAE